MLWLALTVLAVGAALLTALPFLRTQGAASAPPQQHAILKSQLAEVERDAAAGEVDAESATAMRLEIERHIIAAAPAPMIAVSSSPVLDRTTAAVVAAIVVLGSVALYVATGRPDLISAHSPSSAGTPPVANGGGPQQGLPDVDTMIQRLAVRLQTQPNDADGWRMLGWSYFETQHYTEAVTAYRHATTLAPTNASYRSALGEAITSAANGVVTADAQRELRTALARDRTDERAKYLLALAKAQRGDARGAVDDWLRAIQGAAPNSQWATRSREQAISVAQQNGISLSGRLPPAPVASTQAAPGPSPEAVAQAGAIPADARAQLINGMVEGLDQRLRQNPRDAEGWARLMRSRMVLGQPDQAADALRRGLAAFANDPDTQHRLRLAAADLGIPAQAAP